LSSTSCVAVRELPGVTSRGAARLGPAGAAALASTDAPKIRIIFNPNLTSTENLMSIRKQAGVMLAAFLFAGAALAQAPDGKPVRIRGDIVSLQGDILTVHRRSGDTVSIEVKPDVGVSALKAIRLSDVRAGSYVGAEAISGRDGKMTAGSLLVFPDVARGTNEGHFPYDFGANSTMTNANVDTVVTANNGRELKLSYSSSPIRAEPRW